jgi:hypothetical protein
MSFSGSNDILCKKCGHFESLSRAPRADDACPACGSGIYRRLGPSPDPLSHVGQLFRALGSLRGVFFVIGVAFLGSVPHVTLWLASAVMITLASLKIANRAMNVTRKDPIEFPEVSPDELFDRAALMPAGMFALLFLFVPRILFSFAFVAPSDRDEFWGAEQSDDDGATAQAGDEAGWEWNEDEPAPPEDPALAAALEKVQREHGAKQQDLAAALKSADDAATPDGIEKAPKKAAAPVRWLYLLGALALFFYAPMALVSYLRTGSTWALFFIPQGVLAIAGDARGYARLSAVAVTAFVLAFGLDTLTHDWPFWAGPLALIPRNALQLVAWGACGLYVRSRARQLDMPVDGDDWVLLTRPAAPLAAPVEAPRPRPAALSLGDDDDIPMVQGTVLPPDAPR